MEASSETDRRTKIILVVGTRPEAVKLAPIVLALRESESYQPVVVSTGQHHAMVQQVFSLAGIATDAELWVGGPRSARLNELVTAVMRRFEDYCVGTFGDHGSSVASAAEVDDGYPAAVLVHGDTSSAFAAALAAFHLRIPVVHAEAGLRTGGLNLSPFPEELNRELIARIACFHLAPTIHNAENLIHENVPENQIFVTGNTAIDALHWAASLEIPYSDERVAEATTGDGRLVVVTAHRRENWGGGLARIAAGVRRLAGAHPDVRFVVPLHPNPLVRRELGPPLEGVANVVQTEPLDYAEFARLLARCHFVLTDSGGIQEEAPSLGKPVLVTREETERSEGLEAGTLALVGTDPDRILEAGTRLLENERAYEAMANAINPYGDGHAAERIVAALEHLRHGGPAPSPFGPGYRRDAVLEAAGYLQGLKPELLPSARRGVAGEPPPEHVGTWHQP